MDDDDIGWLKRVADDMRWTEQKAPAVGFPFQLIVGDVLRGVPDTLDDIASNALKKKELEAKEK